MTKKKIFTGTSNSFILLQNRVELRLEMSKSVLSLKMKETGKS